ncbi:MAG: response regulator transcription factor [Aquabacterium sp.]|nr:response regulator transcription factor [Aquabacterium sp.]
MGSVQPPPLGTFKVLLVDDHDLVRVGLRTVLNEVEEMKIHWLEADNLHDAMRLFGAEPDVALVLLDLNMADCKGLQGLRQFVEAYPLARVAVMSGTQDEFVIGQAKGLGAVGYLPKSYSPSLTRSNIVGLLTEFSYAAAVAVPSGASATRFPRAPSASSYDRVAELGPRHLEILELVLSGCSNQEISNATKLSLGTVKNYVSTILLALDVKSRSHLISLFR